LVAYYARQKRLPEAEQLLKSMAASNPTAEAPLVKLAAFYVATNRRPEMEVMLQKLVSDTKSFPRARLTTGSFFAKLRDFDRAKHEFEEGMKANSKDKALYQKGLAQLYLMQNKPAEASDLLASVLKDDSKDNEAIAMRSSIRIKTGKPEDVKAGVTDMQA